MLHATRVLIAISIVAPALAAPIHADERGIFDDIESFLGFNKATSTVVAKQTALPTDILEDAGAPLPTQAPSSDPRSLPLEDRGILKDGFSAATHFAGTKVKSLLHKPTKAPSRSKPPKSVPTSFIQFTGSGGADGDGTSGGPSSPIETTGTSSLPTDSDTSSDGVGSLDPTGDDTDPVDPAAGDTGSVDPTGDDTSPGLTQGAGGSTPPTAGPPLSAGGATVHANPPSGEMGNIGGAQGSLSRRLNIDPPIGLLPTGPLRVDPQTSVTLISSATPSIHALGSVPPLSGLQLLLPTTTLSAGPSVSTVPAFPSHRKAPTTVDGTIRSRQPQSRRMHRVARDRLTRRDLEALVERQENLVEGLLDGIFGVAKKVAPAVKDGVQAAKVTGKAANALNDTISATQQRDIESIFELEARSPGGIGSIIGKVLPKILKDAPEIAQTAETVFGGGSDSSSTDSGSSSGDSSSSIADSSSAPSPTGATDSTRRRSFGILEDRSPGGIGSIIGKVLPKILKDAPDIAQTAETVFGGGSDSSSSDSSGSSGESTGTLTDSSSASSPTDATDSARRRSERW